MVVLFSWNLEHLYRRDVDGDHFRPSSPSNTTKTAPLLHPLLGDPNATMAPNTDKLQPFHDPRVQLRSAHLNGKTYGYIYSPRSTSAPNRGTIILIHGFPDMSFGWRYQIPFLSSLGLDVIAPDCMGYGRTDAPPHTLHDYTYARIASDIGALCTQLGLNSVILGGHDWGGAIVYRLAQYHPNLVKALFVICTPYNPQTDLHASPPTSRYHPPQFRLSDALRIRRIRKGMLFALRNTTIPHEHVRRPHTIRAIRLFRRRRRRHSTSTHHHYPFSHLV